jgi:serine/threonine protein kinase
VIGKVIKNNYKVMDEIGRGSVATVYLAKDLAQNRLVALKIVHPEQAAEGQFLQRFQREAKLLQMLSSPQAVQIFDYGEDEELQFIVLEHVQGRTLASILEEEGPLGVNHALDIAKQVALCLVDAHAKSIVHRDLRPANIMVTASGAVKLMDFGIAWGADLSRLTATGVLGSPHYLSPEQASGGEGVDGRSDIYSLGVTLFEMLTGERPYDADRAADIVLAHLQEPIPSLHQLDESVPLEVDELVQKCLAKKPEDRYQSAAELLESIDETLRAMVAEAQGPSLGMEVALVGQALGPYRIIEQIGRGGMATVYKAYEPALDRYVAIKVLPQYFAHDPDFTARFEREAKAVARLNHPNILPIYSFGQGAGLNYIAMRYVEVGTLKEMLGQPLDLETAADVLGQIGRALDYAHRRGIVHRDVKPTNVLMAEGKWALLTDFGLARMVESSVQLTKTGVGVGTPAYMSPEQGQGIKVDARTDIYSLGVMLYEMLTGKVPYEAETPMAVVLKHITAPLPLPREVNPELPEAVERVILKAMAKAPEDRYQTAGEMVEALEKAVAGVPVETSPASTEAAPEPATPASAPVAPPAPAQLPVAALLPVARRVLVWLLRIVGPVLVVLATVVAILLLLGSFAVSSLIERAIAGGAWWEEFQPGEVMVTEAEIEQKVTETVRLYMPGSLEDVSLDFTPPDRIDVQGTVFGKEMTLECTLTSADGMIDFEIERLGDVRLYVVGNILSGGINRGLETGLEERSLTVEKLKVGEKSLTIKYGSMVQTIPPTSTLIPGPRQTPMPTATPRPHRTPTATSACKIYVVQEGDSLSKIAKRFGVTVEDLLEANPQIKDRSIIRVGWELCIPK